LPKLLWREYERVEKTLAGKEQTRSGWKTVYNQPLNRNYRVIKTKFHILVIT